jgi:FecR protein
MTTHRGDEPREQTMNKEYLWDRCGAPDPEIQRLESLLSEFRHDERPLVLPAELPAAPGKARGLLIQMPWLPRLAAAAVILVGLGASALFLLPTKNPSNSGPAWNVATLEGAPQIGSQIISGNSTAAKLHIGQTLVTNANSRATITEENLGEIQVDANSRVRLLQSGPNNKRIQLDVGTIHAAIWAPPGQFVVDTPSASAVDLGCAYTLQVAPDGSGTIRTTLGWVGFHRNGRDSFIPAGAICSTRPRSGPGTPCFEDASASFREALEQFDSAAPNSPEQNAALAKVLQQARARDALSLWHLLSRTEAGARVSVYNRLATLVPPPDGVTRDGILQLNPNMLDLYWNALDLGDISIWRYFEQSSSPNATPPPQLLERKQLLLKQPAKP